MRIEHMAKVKRLNWFKVYGDDQQIDSINVWLINQDINPLEFSIRYDDNGFKYLSITFSNFVHISKFMEMWKVYIT